MEYHEQSPVQKVERLLFLRALAVDNPKHIPALREHKQNLIDDLKAVA